MHQSASHHPSWPCKLREHKVEWLVLLFVFLLPFGETSHLPVLILLALGIRDIHRGELRIDASIRPLAWFAALLTLPLLITAATAYDPARTLRTVLMFSLYAIAGLYVIDSFRKRLDENFLLYGIAAILLFWTADALLQFFSGENVFGWPYNNRRLTGIYNQNMWIGYTLAHLAPFFAEALRRFSSTAMRKWVWLLFPPYLAVILLSGGRAAWITIAMMLLVLPIYLVRRGDLRWLHAGLLMAGIIATAAGSIAFTPELQKRISTTMLALSTNIDEINTATALRVDVWRGAWLLYQDAPIIGHGTHAYENLTHERGYTTERFGHEHLYGLQIMVATGIVGFMAYMLGFLTICRRFVLALKARSTTAMPWLAALLILFPLNAHWNFYAPRPASLMWILLILAIALHHRLRRQ